MKLLLPSGWCLNCYSGDQDCPVCLGSSYWKERAAGFEEQLDEQDQQITELTTKVEELEKKLKELSGG